MPESQSIPLYQQESASVVEGKARIETFATRPSDLEQTGVPRSLLGDLIVKHLLEAGVLDLGQLARRMSLPGSAIEDLLHALREDGQVELRSRRDSSVLLRFGLTDRGRSSAIDAIQRDGYVGPAPITLEHYERAVEAQSARHYRVTRQEIRQIFDDLVIRPEILHRLGPAAHSGRATFIYGHPGTGKSYIARHLIRAIGPPVLLPYAIAIGDHVIRYFDPSVHQPVTVDVSEPATRLNEGHDARFVLCHRPAVVGGGELTMDLLDLQYDQAKHMYIAPLQLKANCGLLIIDDLGRQRIRAEELLNRWILPMEEKRDQLVLSTGQHFSVPFDLTLVFSTNLNPEDLADEAFLRRIGYKIRFPESSPAEYGAIWKKVCEQFGIEFDPMLLDFVVEQRYETEKIPLLPCHPRDLIQIALDYVTYNGSPRIDKAALEWAWQSYFLDT